MKRINNSPESELNLEEIRVELKKKKRKKKAKAGSALTWMHRDVRVVAIVFRSIRRVTLNGERFLPPPSAGALRTRTSASRVTEGGRREGR